MPGFAGGDEWGGVAIDPATGVLYVNANDTAWLVGLTVPQPAGSLGEKVYQGQCSACHGMDRAGAPPAVPALEGIEGILTDDEIAAIIRQGRGRMPSFNSLSDEQVRAVVRYLTKAATARAGAEAGHSAATKKTTCLTRPSPFAASQIRRVIRPPRRPGAL